jgi:hypothetical protein
MEQSLAEELSGILGRAVGPEALIIDLPEPVSFESGLFVTDEECFFSDSSSAFKNTLIDSFIKSLRIIRVFVDPAYFAEIRNFRKSILKIIEKRYTIRGG